MSRKDSVRLGCLLLAVSTANLFCVAHRDVAVCAFVYLLARIPELLDLK